MRVRRHRKGRRQTPAPRASLQAGKFQVLISKYYTDPPHAQIASLQVPNQGDSLELVRRSDNTRLSVVVPVGVTSGTLLDLHVRYPQPDPCQSSRRVAVYSAVVH